MLEKIFLLSCIITGIYAAFAPGMIMSWLRIAVANALDKLFGKLASRYIQKPLWDCLPCMAGIYTIVITQTFDVLLILAVCGMNQMIESVILSRNE